MVAQQLSAYNSDASGILPSPESVSATTAAPKIVGLQTAALVDRVSLVDSDILDGIPGVRGGSIPVTREQLELILMEQCEWKPIAGGSVANTIRGLRGFGVKSGLIGACGDDEQGRLFVRSMSSCGVDLSGLKIKNGSTAQCVCLVDERGDRTMRPCFEGSATLEAQDLTQEDFKGSKWLVLRYASQDLDVIKAAIDLAKQEDLFVSLDLASFEMVCNSKPELLELLETGNIDLCFANEDEAKELLSDKENSGTRDALNFLAQHCAWAVVTLGSKGSMAKHGNEFVRVEAMETPPAIDATGAGDLFASGFLYGLLKGLPLGDCCLAGSLSGGSVIGALGGAVTSENLQWMYKQMKTNGLPVPDLGEAESA